MRVCIEQATGKLLEAQSGGEGDAHLEALYRNAQAAGYTPAQVEVKYIPDEEFHTLLAAQTTGAMTYADKRRAEYPPMADYLDAKVKQASNDPMLQEAGRLQEAAYHDACLEVKARYPKG